LSAQYAGAKDNSSVGRIRLGVRKKVLHRAPYLAERCGKNMSMDGRVAFKLAFDSQHEQQREVLDRKLKEVRKESQKWLAETRRLRRKKTESRKRNRQRPTDLRKEFRVKLAKLHEKREARRAANSKKIAARECEWLTSRKKCTYVLIV